MWWLWWRSLYNTLSSRDNPFGGNQSQHSNLISATLFKPANSLMLALNIISTGFHGESICRVTPINTVNGPNYLEFHDGWWLDELMIDWTTTRKTKTLSIGIDNSIDRNLYAGQGPLNYFEFDALIVREQRQQWVSWEPLSRYYWSTLKGTWYSTWIRVTAIWVKFQRAAGL